MVIKKSDAGEMEFGMGPFKVTLTGRLAKQAMIGMIIAVGFWYEQKQLLAEIRGLHFDVLKMNITGKAIVEALPITEQTKAKKIIEDKMAILRLAYKSQNSLEIPDDSR